MGGIWPEQSWVFKKWGEPAHHTRTHKHLFHYVVILFVALLSKVLILMIHVMNHGRRGVWVREGGGKKKQDSVSFSWYPSFTLSITHSLTHSLSDFVFFSLTPIKKYH